jgi:hypothetical protein
MLAGSLANCSRQDRPCLRPTLRQKSRPFADRGIHCRRNHIRRSTLISLSQNRATEKRHRSAHINSLKVSNIDHREKRRRTKALHDSTITKLRGSYLTKHGRLLWSQGQRLHRLKRVIFTTAGHFRSTLDKQTISEFFGMSQRCRYRIHRSNFAEFPASPARSWPGLSRLPPRVP